MKTVLLVCEGMADEPLEELAGRTPLEVAKTPHCDLLAKQGSVAQGSFVSSALRPSSDVAAMSLLGFDPQEFYTGIAPLEAIAMGIQQTDKSIAFRCNLVSVLDESLVDPYSGNISPTESRILINALNEKLSNNRIRFYAGKGFRNILIIDDAELSESLDDLDCVPPQAVIGQKILKNFPKGEGASSVIDLITAAKEILENHEINKVRIDLQENPANLIWPWGQGKKPKIPAFRQRYNVEGCVVSTAVCIQGLSQALRLEKIEGLETAIEKKDFAFIYYALAEGTKMDLASKIKVIEEFDASVVGPVMEKLKNYEHRLCVTSDTLLPIVKQNPTHGYVPLLFEGSGIEADGTTFFNEKSALASKQVFNEGHKMMEFFLKH